MKTLKPRCLKWVQHVLKMDSRDPAKILMLQNPVHQQCRERPKLRYIDNVEEDLRYIGMRG